VSTNRRQEHAGSSLLERLISASVGLSSQLPRLQPGDRDVAELREAARGTQLWPHRQQQQQQQQQPALRQAAAAPQLTARSQSRLVTRLPRLQSQEQRPIVRQGRESQLQCGVGSLPPLCPPSSPDGVNEKRDASFFPPSGTCCVCMDNQSVIVLLPCHHLCLCEECLMRLFRRRCPYCNQVFLKASRVYIP
ncbi:hypothetical protein DQ04_23881000, partial [Trypanosoma grayi]|uniref:hypothetical protein n=1 Tax=Trypanosoma grayi TaxID=71804 RepID=UPI0004F44567